MISVRILLSLANFSSLGDIGLVDLTTHSDILEFKSGKTLDAKKYQAKIIYLLSGTVEVTDPENNVETFQSDTPRAQKPVFRLRLPGYKAKCKCACTALFIDEKIYDKYINDAWDGGGSTILNRLQDEIPKNADDKLMADIEKKFLHDEIKLPSLPEMAIHIQSALTEEGLSLSKIAGIIQSDPAISTRVIQVANSPIFRGSQNITSIKNAIAKIGLDAIHAIVISVALRGLFKPDSVLLKKAMAQYYENSIRTGIIAYVLARNIPGYERDRAFLSGLLHDIGVIPLLFVADIYPELTHQAGNLESTIEKLKGKVGSMLLEHWDFDEGLCDIAAHAYDWQWQSTDNSPDYVGLVQIALLHSPLVGGKKIKGPPLCDIPAFKNLGLDKINPADDLQQLKEVTKRVTEMIKILCL